MKARVVDLRAFRAGGPHGGMMADLVVISQSEGILRLRVNRPEKKNALTRAMYQTLADALDRADDDETVRVITITGTGDVFTSGNDLGDFLDGGPIDGDSPVMRFLAAIARARKPLIAGVNGLAVGIGVTMLLHCDLVYAAEEATFLLPFVNLGLVPEAASSLLLPRLVGHQRAAELLFFGNTFDAETAFTVGLVNAVHPRGALDGVVEKSAATLAAKPQASLQLTKELLKGSLSQAVSARMTDEAEHVRRMLSSPEAREAMQAILEKRPPDFRKLA
jgi:enoyl-CoA hydratase/carnithine racemase